MQYSITRDQSKNQTNVFLRSTRRQPVWALCLALMVLFVTFAFVGRVSEYLLIRQETERLEGYYRAIGTLEGKTWANAEDVAVYLEEHPSVQTVNVYNYTSGVMQGGIRNGDIDLKQSWNNRYLIFYGTLQLMVENKKFDFRVDTVLAGLPEYIEEGKLIRLKYENEREGIDAEAACAQLEVGTRYLAVGLYSDIGCSVNEFGTEAQLRPLGQDMFFYPLSKAEEADWSDPRLGEWGSKVMEISDEQSALNIIPLADMSVLPMVQEEDSQIYLTEGRWLDKGDNISESKVCVINAEFAALRKLRLGDTISLKLRDIPSYLGYCSGSESNWTETEAEAYEIIGIFDYTSTYQCTVMRNFAYIPASAVPSSFEMTTAENLNIEWFENHLGQLGVDESSLPPYPGSITFVLSNPEQQSQFIAETRADLERMGFRVAFLDNGLENFQTTSESMRQSSLYNAFIYSAILLAAFSLTAFVYFFMRRHDLAIVRALGVPVRRCVREISLPMLLLGLAGILVGGTFGWRYTLANATKMLEALAAFGDGSVAPLPAGWLVLLWAVAALLLLVLTVGGAAILARRPVLAQMQGGATVKEKRRTARQDAIAASGEAVRVSELSFDSAVLAHPLPQTRSLGAAHTLRFVWRHIARARMKTFLAVALAAGFTIGLGGIQLSIAANRQEVDRLYETTSVSIELTKADSTQTTTAGAFLFDDTVQAIFDTGFITDAYLEGANQCRVFLYDDSWEKGQVLSVRPSQQTNRTIRSIDNTEAFLTVGSGMDAAITYLDGWDAGLFAEDWAAKDAVASDSDPVIFPIVLPKETYDEYRLQPGEVMGMACKSAFRVCEVAGYYEGEVTGEYHSGPNVTVHYDENAPILMPTSALRSMVRNMLYSKAIFTVDPMQNRNLDTFRTEVDALANMPRISGVPTRTILRDEELRLVIEPIENSIRLMEVLYPVALVLSLLAAAGVSILFVMLSAKEAAILRIQGTTKLLSVLMLSLQQVFACFTGLVIGLTGILAYIGGTRPDLLDAIVPSVVRCAALYLIAGIIGAVASSAVTGKNPLEMLQVKE